VGRSVMMYLDRDVGVDRDRARPSLSNDSKPTWSGVNRLDDARRLVALGRLPGVGTRTVASIARSYPVLAAVHEEGEAGLVAKVGKRAATALLEGFATGWAPALAEAERIIERHVTAGITPLPITDDAYPPLLRLIDDPPPVLYVRGDLSVVANPNTVAVVGTREPTPRGMGVSHKIAARFAQGGYVVVSGLAKGIDTAGHEGALEVGPTVAILGGALDTIYPAENRGLADRIEGRGALITEYPLGDAGRATNFVARDRIQAGMSLAVIPVQTGLVGGTQHTIRFATEAQRLLLCPRPLEDEAAAPSYEGIWDLVRSGRAREFGGDDYEDLFEALRQKRLELERIDWRQTRGPKDGRSSRKGKDGAAEGQLTFETDEIVAANAGFFRLGELEAEPGPVDMAALLGALEAVFDAEAPSLDEAGFSGVLRALRARRFPARG
jgi:DNA processing protein